MREKNSRNFKVQTKLISLQAVMRAAMNILKIFKERKKKKKKKGSVVPCNNLYDKVIVASILEKYGNF